jgi:nucleoside-diphosphate-sugar epimerase
MKQKIAILGATGYIGKSLLAEFFADSVAADLYVFSRSKSKLQALAKQIPKGITLHNLPLSDFGKHTYHAVINCTGLGSPSSFKKEPQNIFSVTEVIDVMVMNYLTKKKKTKYINLSSGAVYGDNFTKPVQNDTKTILDINNLKIPDYYSIAKINAEARHRAMSELHIVDLRIFAFFSRFADSKAGFLMSEIIDCVVNKKTFVTGPGDIVRDYISSRDLYTLVTLAMRAEHCNDSFDVYSKKPVSKFEMLKHLEKKFGLTYRVQGTLDAKAKLLKNVYCSKDTKAKHLGYHPSLSSLQCIDEGLQFIVENGEGVFFVSDTK